MKILLRLVQAIDAFNRGWGQIASWLVLIACLVSAGNAGLRYAANFGSNAWLEAQWYMFAAMVMFGAAYTLQVNEHVRVDLIYGRLSDRACAWVDLAGLVLFLMPTMVLMAWLAWPVFSESWRIGEVSANAGGLARWPVKLALPIGFTLVVLQGAAEIVKRIAYLTGAAPLGAKYERPLQ